MDLDSWVNEDPVRLGSIPIARSTLDFDAGVHQRLSMQKRR